MTKWKQLSEKDFKDIKMLQNAGLNPNQASRATKRAASTITRVYEAESFENYKEITKQFNENYKQKDEPETLAAVDTIADDVAEALAGGGLLVTRKEKYDLHGLVALLERADKQGVTVAFTPNK